MSTLHPTAEFQSTRSQLGEPTWEIALMYPTQGHWSEEEYLRLTDQNWLVEFHDGRIEVLPMPTLYHQLMLRLLHSLLQKHVDEHADGEVLFAPLPVRLNAQREYREPDIVYLSDERLKNTEKYPDGADLVMEIVSEGIDARNRDLIEKRQDYAAAGIREYWIIDPENREIHVLTLVEDSYQDHGVFNASQRATSAMFDGFSVDVNDVFDVQSQSS